MTIQLDHLATAQEAVGELTDEDFDLDITVIEGGISIADQLRMTDDNCGTTCESACTSCD
jgi:FxLD family lantipeptide